MQSQSQEIKSRKNKIFIALIVLLALLFSPIQSQAQGETPELEPQKVYARGEGYTDEGILIVCTIEVWNVGAAGGDEYADATITCEFEGYENKIILTGTFSGGPNGTVELWDENGESHNIYHFIDGKIAQKEGHEDEGDFIVENPEAFTAFVSTPTPSPTPTSTPYLPDCQATIVLPPDLKKGDDIWMSATYVDPEGSAVPSETILSESWVTNGKDGYPTGIWDGQAMKIELQYTCPNGKAYLEVYHLPAYQEEPQGPAEIPPEVEPDGEIEPVENDQAPEDEETSKSLLLPLLIGGVLVAGAGLLIGGGLITYVVAKNKGIIGGKPQKPAQSKPSPTNQTRPPVKQEPIPSKPVSPQLPAVTQRPPRFEYPKPPTKEEIANLKKWRAEVETEIEKHKREWQENEEKLHRLQRIQKKNLIKRMLQLGLETEDIVTTTSAPSLAAKILSIPVEEAMGKPSPEKETEILLIMDKLIRDLKGRMEFLQKEVRRLRAKIQETDEILNK